MPDLPLHNPKYNAVDVSEDAARYFGGEDYVPRWRDLPKCIGCNRPMRPYGQRWREWPAAVTRVSADTCAMCYNRNRRVSGERVSDPDLPTVPRPKTRAQIAAGWTEEQHAAAWSVCGSAVSAEVASEILDLLGLFEESDLTFTTSIPRFNEDFGSTEVLPDP